MPQMTIGVYCYSLQTSEPNEQIAYLLKCFRCQYQKTELLSQMAYRSSQCLPFPANGWVVVRQPSEILQRVTSYKCQCTAGRKTTLAVGDPLSRAKRER